MEAVEFTPGMTVEDGKLYEYEGALYRAHCTVFNCYDLPIIPNCMWELIIKEQEK